MFAGWVLHQAAGPGPYLHGAGPTISGPDPRTSLWGPVRSEVRKGQDRTADSLLASPTEPTTDPLLWWIEKRAVYPCLARMALNYLSIPGKFYLALLRPFFDIIFYYFSYSHPPS